MIAAQNHSSDLINTKQTQPEMKSSAASANRNNNFNVMRLFFATLVLLSHSTELADGNRHREILTRLFGTVSLGDLAVNAFFLLSGFLIVQSWQRDPNVFNFLKKRVLRIYPAFIVSLLISSFVVGPLGSDASQFFAQFNPYNFSMGSFFLCTPILPPVFEGSFYPEVNGSLISIAFELRCYLLVALFGVCGVVGRRYLWLVLFGGVLFLSLPRGIVARIPYSRPMVFLAIDPGLLMIYLAIFCAGGCFYLFRDHIRYKTSWALMAAVIMIFCMFRTETLQFAFVILGAYIIFWFAHAQFPFLVPFRTYPDISYGVYLYGWPIQKLLLWNIPSLSPWLLFLLTFGLSCILGLLSWHLVERPFLQLKPR